MCGRSPQTTGARQKFWGLEPVQASLRRRPDSSPSKTSARSGRRLVDHGGGRSAPRPAAAAARGEEPTGGSNPGGAAQKRVPRPPSVPPASNAAQAPKPGTIRYSRPASAPARSTQGSLTARIKATLDASRRQINSSRQTMHTATKQLKTSVAWADERAVASKALAKKAEGKTYVCTWPHVDGGKDSYCAGLFSMDPAEHNHCYATPPRPPPGCRLPDHLEPTAPGPLALPPPPPLPDPGPCQFPPELRPGPPSHSEPPHPGAHEKPATPTLNMVVMPKLATMYSEYSEVATMPVTIDSVEALRATSSADKRHHAKTAKLVGLLAQDGARQIEQGVFDWQTFESKFAHCTYHWLGCILFAVSDLN